MCKYDIGREEKTLLLTLGGLLGTPRYAVRTAPVIKPANVSNHSFLRSGCGVQPADILFIVDSSGSVGASNFQKTLGFIQNMTNGFNVGPHDIQIGMITFDTKPYLQFHLNKFHNKNNVINAVGHTQYTKGGTYTHLALKYASDTSFTPANGAR